MSIRKYTACTIKKTGNYIADKIMGKTTVICVMCYRNYIEHKTCNAVPSGMMSHIPMEVYLSEWEYNGKHWNRRSTK